MSQSECGIGLWCDLLPRKNSPDCLVQLVSLYFFISFSAVGGLLTARNLQSNATILNAPYLILLIYIPDMMFAKIVECIANSVIKSPVK